MASKICISEKRAWVFVGESWPKFGENFACKQHYYKNVKINKKRKLRLTHRNLKNHFPPPLAQRCVPHHERRGKLCSHPACYTQSKPPGKEISLNLSVIREPFQLTVQKARNRRLPPCDKIQAYFSVFSQHI